MDEDDDVRTENPPSSNVKLGLLLVYLDRMKSELVIHVDRRTESVHRNLDEMNAERGCTEMPSVTFSAAGTRSSSSLMESRREVPRG